MCARSRDSRYSVQQYRFSGSVFPYNSYLFTEEKLLIGVIAAESPFPPVNVFNYSKISIISFENDGDK